MEEKWVVAIKGLVGWHYKGCNGLNDTSLSGVYGDEPKYKAQWYVDRSQILKESNNPAGLIWKEPNLQLSLPPDNVRAMFEGCIGNEGSTDGHKWEGGPCGSWESVGLNVWLELQRRLGAVVIKGE